MPWYKKLHWQIIVGLVLGLIYGVIAASAGWIQFTSDWISPFGTIFLRLLQLIAVPLVLASLITGVASLSNLQKLSRIGGKTIAIYLGTTFIALIIGLVIVNVLQPGGTVPPDVRDQLQESYSEDAAARQQQADLAKERGPLQVLVDIVPSNFFSAASSNRNMLQIVFFSIFVGIGLIMIPKEKGKPLLDLFDSLNDLIIKLVDVIMYLAPIGVFALLAGTITSIAGGG
ncbi:MAG: dicarboxylate/amino acid:cation symporter, partial [Rhodothermales bacterium]